MNVSLGELACFVEDLLALREHPGLRPASRRLIDAMVRAAERNRAHRGQRSSAGTVGGSGGTLVFTVDIR